MHRERENIHPASTVKVAVMMEAFQQAEQGKLSFDERMTVRNSFISIADGSTFCTYAEDDAEKSLYERIGTDLPLPELVRLMIVRSSNLVTNILIGKLEARSITDYLRQLGISEVTVLRGPEDNRAFALGLNNSANARGLMKLMIAIAESRAVSRAASERMIEIPLGQDFNEGIPARLPATVRVAHKTGWNDRMYHDFGIIFPADRPAYVLAVMTSGFEEERQAHESVARLSQLIFDALSMG